MPPMLSSVHSLWPPWTVRRIIESGPGSRVDDVQEVPQRPFLRFTQPVFWRADITPGNRTDPVCQLLTNEKLDAACTIENAFNTILGGRSRGTAGPSSPTVELMVLGVRSLKGAVVIAPSTDERAIRPTSTNPRISNVHVRLSLVDAEMAPLLQLIRPGEAETQG